jgi:tetratricopeptide (TPR) repeat protein
MKPIKLVLLIFILCLTSCGQFKFLSVPIDYDPRFSFKPDTTTILLINQFDVAKTKIGTKRKTDVYRAGIFSAVKYARMQLSGLPHVKIINLVDSASVKPTIDSIKVLAAQHHADYVLALTNFDADISLDGVQSSTAYYTSNVSVNFTLFEANGIFFKKLQGISNEPQFSGPYMGLIASLLIHPTVGGNKDAITISAEHATQIALQDYLPYTITHNRPLYANEILQPAVNEILTGHFDKAYNLLKPLLDDKDPKLASKAAYNLAVVYEAQGDFDIATNMAQLSLDKNRNQFAAGLLEDLKAE